MDGAECEGCLRADVQFTERFQREAKALARLSHPNIVTIHDFMNRTLVAFFCSISGALGFEPLEPRGQLHIPIGVPNSLDTLKTFVEAEGNFSPGFGSFGVFYALEDGEGKLISPTREGVASEHGLAPGGLLVPWSQWQAGLVQIRSELCSTKVQSPAGDIFVTAARVVLTNRAATETRSRFHLRVQSKGAAGGPIHALAYQNGLLLNGRSALVAAQPPARVSLHSGKASETAGSDPVKSATGDAAADLQWDVTLAGGASETFEFICPVLAGRRAVGHRWDGVSTWAQLDLADPISGEGGVLQPDPGIEFFRKLKVADLFTQTLREGRELAGKVQLELPDPRWAECFSAIVGHAALSMNEGAPDVAVINYNVFSRDGVYVANILQKAGSSALAGEAIEYFLKHPFNGRVDPEADNPGQMLWILGEHWRFTRDEAWLARIYPSAQKLAAMIAYYRTTPEPHWVNAESLDFGDALPSEKRQRLLPGACDGFHPEYTEAFDIAGLRAATGLAAAIKNPSDLAAWQALAAKLSNAYDERFGADLRKGEYGNYSVLWPCRLYPLAAGKGHEQFRDIGAQKPTSWRYFPLARAHQGLLAGNRAAGHGTLSNHLAHEQMRGWYAFDEGGPSGPGNWMKVKSNWKVSGQPLGAIAMPHGWSIAEVHLLLRDSLAFEDGDKLVLFGGVPEAWFQKPMRLGNLPTYFGLLSVAYEPTANGGKLTFTGEAAPPEGFVIRLPGGDLPVPAGTRSMDVPVPH